MVTEYYGPSAYAPRAVREVRSELGRKRGKSEVAIVCAHTSFYAAHAGAIVVHVSGIRRVDNLHVVIRERGGRDVESVRVGYVYH